MKKITKITIITISGIFISWLLSMIGFKIQSDILSSFGWFLTFIIAYNIGKKIENLKWRGLLK